MEWLKAMRLEQRKTQSEVANAARLKQSTYCNIENGKRKPSVPAAKRIGIALGFDWKLLFDGGDS